MYPGSYSKRPSVCYRRPFNAKPFKLYVAINQSALNRFYSSKFNSPYRRLIRMKIAMTLVCLRLCCSLYIKSLKRNNGISQYYFNKPLSVKKIPYLFSHLKCLLSNRPAWLAMSIRRMLFNKLGFGTVTSLLSRLVRDWLTWKEISIVIKSLCPQIN